MTTTSKNRTGYSTGTCAAAAAKAAALVLAGVAVEAVDISLPSGERVVLPVEAAGITGPGRAWAELVKDAGDDPDVTDGVTVHVDLEVTEGLGVGPGAGLSAGSGTELCAGSCSDPESAALRSVSSRLPAVQFVAGEGVGTVTRAGLQLDVGEPAINPVPRRMIAEALQEALDEAHSLGDGSPGMEKRYRVTITIPGGRELAERTFNPRLGIAGGLSILGTSGRVIPRSEEAWLRSLIPQVDVALAAGVSTVYLVPGGFGERAAQKVLDAPEVAIVRCSNFIGALIDVCAERGVERLVLVGHVGKLVKVAAGIFDTHSRHGDARLETVAALAGAAGAPAGLVGRLLELPTVEAAIPALAEAGLTDVWDDIAERAAQRSEARAALTARAANRVPPPVDCLLVGYDDLVLGCSGRLREALVTSRLGGSPGITVVGVGPGAEEHASAAAWQAVKRAHVVVGGARHLDRFAPAQAERIVIGSDMDAVEAAVRDRLHRRVVVVASGDPSCYGILATLRRRFPDIALQVVPGISSFQLALVRLGLSWEAVRFASAHGRGIDEVLAAVCEHPRVLALTDLPHNPQALAAGLLEAGIDGRMTVLERLGYSDENVVEGNLSEIADGRFDPLSVVLIDTSPQGPLSMGTVTGPQGPSLNYGDHPYKMDDREET
ncbi:MAG: cobalt-precorrin-5B (C(1))-methyltransferase CbiD [Thermoleophilia bacterium]